MKRGKEILTYGDIEIEKYTFYRYKTSVHLRDVDIEKVLVSKKISFGEKSYKYIIGYLHNDEKIKPLHIKLSKTSAYAKGNDGQTEWINFLIEDNELLKSYSTIWDKVTTDIKKELDSKPVYSKEFLKTQINFHGDKVTDFHDKKLSKMDSNHTCLAVISLDSALKKDENYYLKVFLKEFKYIEKKLMRHINDNLSDFSSSDQSDVEWLQIINT